MQKFQPVAFAVFFFSHVLSDITDQTDISKVQCVRFLAENIQD